MYSNNILPTPLATFNFSLTLELNIRKCDFSTNSLTLKRSQVKVIERNFFFESTHRQHLKHRVGRARITSSDRRRHVRFSERPRLRSGLYTNPFFFCFFLSCQHTNSRIELMAKLNQTQPDHTNLDHTKPNQTKPN